MLNFESKVDLEEGVSRFVDWVIIQKVSTDKFDNSMAEIRVKGILR